MPCSPCPCPDACLRWPSMCDMAASEPPDPVQLRWICERSATGGVPAAHAPPRPHAARPDVAEAVALVAAARACPFRSTDAGCGCSGSRCALRRHAIVTHLDCIDCVKKYG